MDLQQTGKLIAETRQSKGLTQKELAAQLHVSDRAISKWERGVGFPDVSLLEPLAHALELNVLDVLRGERCQETNAHAAVQEALDALKEQRKADRRRLRKELVKGLLWFLVVGAILSRMFPLRTDVDQTITAGVYRDGTLIAYTTVEQQGQIEHDLLTGKKGYWGRFGIGCVEWTTRDNVHAGVSLTDEFGGLTYSMAATLTGSLRDVQMLLSLDMTEFAFALSSPSHLVDGEPRAEHWYVLATSPEMYERYCAQMGNLPPALDSLHPEQLPDFPVPW